jgi:hypothetical protein
MEVVANKHSKKYPIELNYRDIDKTVSLVFTLDNKASNREILTKILSNDSKRTD